MESVDTSTPQQEPLQDQALSEGDLERVTGGEDGLPPLNQNSTDYDLDYD